LANGIIATALDWSHRKLLRRSRFSVCSSSDYAEYSRLSHTLSENNKRIITVTSKDRRGGIPRYRDEEKRTVGFIGRPTHEKGVDVLLEAISILPKDVRLLFAGPTAGLTEKMGFDETLAKRLIQEGRMVSLGFLEDDEISDFYASLDAYAHTSVNSFDAFGIVQVEAMSAGIPVAASDIPGVRTVVQSTGFGELTQAGSAVDLARALEKVLEAGYDAEASRSILEKNYLFPVPHQQYLDLFNGLAGKAGT
jgi:glycosyltransferase involved in cell wall biosynthesis